MKRKEEKDKKRKEKEKKKKRKTERKEKRKEEKGLPKILESLIYYRYPSTIPR